MQAYAITYKVRGKDDVRQELVDAKNLTSAKRKLGHKHGYKDGRMIQVQRCTVVGCL